MIKKEFLDISTPVFPQGPCDINWCAGDNPETFADLLKKKPLDWMYRTKTVQYNWNELGYRTPSFSNVIWKDSIILFGDSQMLGVGLDESQCLRTLMSKSTGKEVISLAVNGSSGMFHWANSIKLKKWLGDVNPLAVIIMWPTWERFFLKEEENFIHVGSWFFNLDNSLLKFLDDSNIKIYNTLIRESFVDLWRDSFVIECRTKPEDPWPVSRRVPWIETDRARDDKHLGPIWASLQTESWTRKLKRANVI